MTEALLEIVMSLLSFFVKGLVTSVCGKSSPDLPGFCMSDFLGTGQCLRSGTLNLVKVGMLAPHMQVSTCYVIVF